MNKPLMALAERLFPICRSITGPGVRETLSILQEEFPGLKVASVPSGTRVFDWTVPREWEIRDAWVEAPDGRRIIDFQDSNLHVVGYSVPVDAVVSRDELLQHLYVQEDQPEVIPYVTSYYKERWGFCCTRRLRDSLAEGNYRVHIGSRLFDGELNYGEILLPGEEEKEVMFSTYICHPSMANNELSGPIVSLEVAKWLAAQPHRRYSYRFVFIPETIGSITYLSRHLEELQRKVVAGFNITCIGDPAHFSYVASPYGDNLADRVAQHVLRALDPDFKTYSFLERGSDERQYCSPRVNLPFCCLCRSKFEEYPEYHTSADNLDFITEEALQGSVAMLKEVVSVLEHNRVYRVTVPCEPQLGPRGLYPTISRRDTFDQVKAVRNLLAYADGRSDLLAISDRIGVPVRDLIPLVEKLGDLLEVCN
ncbi:MAG: DUF4910 domain-containing protein [Bacteroidales bacterium]|nr:DUF4910 domain-containing protein [Bacteroidales bacterium]